MNQKIRLNLLSYIRNNVKNKLKIRKLVLILFFLMENKILFLMFK